MLNGITVRRLFWISLSLSGLRTIAITSCLAASACFTIWMPVPPVAPSTAIFMVKSTIQTHEIFKRLRSIKLWQSDVLSSTLVAHGDQIRASNKIAYINIYQLFRCPRWIRGITCLDRYFRTIAKTFLSIYLYYKQSGLTKIVKTFGTINEREKKRFFFFFKGKEDFSRQFPFRQMAHPLWFFWQTYLERDLSMITDA